MLKTLPKVAAVTSATITFLSYASGVFAQSATSSGKGGTGSALPDAGTTELTYFIFVFGVVLFVVGMLKLVLSYRE